MERNTTGKGRKGKLKNNKKKRLFSMLISIVGRVPDALQGIGNARVERYFPNTFGKHR